MNKKTQKTPTGHKIPNPSKEDFFKDLEKATEPVEKEKDTDVTDELGGGGEGLTKKGFRFLKRKTND